MKIVCICEDEASVNCVASGLIQDHEIPLLIVPDFNAPRPAKVWKKAAKTKFIAKVINKLFFSLFPRKASRSRVREEIRQRGSGELEVAKACPEIRTIPSHEINSEATAELIAEHQPDLLFVCGAPILKRRIFTIAKHGAVNFHYGYSPKYKGQHTLLWAFNRRDHACLGGTFLKIDKGVDTGTPISFVYPEVDKGDSLEVIEAKLAVLARDHISNAIKAVAVDSGLPARPARDGDPVQKDFMIRFADYGPLVHAVYYFQLLRNKLFCRNPILREEQVEAA